jgi:hypothetical protein
VGEASGASHARRDEHASRGESRDLERRGGLRDERRTFEVRSQDHDSW